MAEIWVTLAKSAGKALAKAARAREAERCMPMVLRVALHATGQLESTQLLEMACVLDETARTQYAQRTR